MAYGYHAMKPWRQGPQNLDVKRLTPDILRELSEPWITTYIETGTFWGYQLRFAAEVFEHVIGIEIDEDCVNKTREWCAGLSNVRVVHGDSRDWLPRLTLDIHDPCFFYLDAHWCDHPDQYLTPSPSPLFTELAYIHDRELRDVVFVDDVHAFGGEGWEDVSIPSVLNALEAERHEVVKDGLVVWL